MLSPMAILRRAREAREARDRELALNPEDSSSGKKFKQLYKLGDKLGQGAFSVVKEATHKQSGKSFAIKIVNKYRLNDEDAQALQTEIAILQESNHTNIVTLYDVFESTEFFYLVTEKYHGGCLHTRIASHGRYNEVDGRIACRHMFDALAYVHKHSVAHRDLKLENLLLTSKDHHTDIRLIDFGFAKRVTSPNCLRTLIGTPGYVSPCILEGTGYGTQADNWSMGVVVYCLLGGYPPFRDPNRDKLFRKIRKGAYEFHERKWKDVSEDAKNFIRRLLTVDSKKRLTARQALEDPWMVMEETLDDGMSLSENSGVSMPEAEPHHSVVMTA